MKRQGTRSFCVCENLKRRIVSGQLRPGSRLPSPRNLCEEYNVGIATITRALNTLKTKGLIGIQIRHAPVVLPQDLRIPGISTILEQQDYILQVYETYELLLSYLLAFAVWDYSIEIVPHYRQAQRAARSEANIESWKALVALTRGILGASQNSLLYDLYTVFELQGNFAYFLEKSIYFWGSIRLRPAFEPKSIIVVLQGQNLVEQLHHLKALYRDTYNIVSEILNQMSDNISTIPTQVSSTSEWSPLGGKNYYHTRIVHDLIRKIGTGIYVAGSYLPYEAQLAKQYGVLAYTARKILGLLEHRDYTKTLNDKGMVVLTSDQPNMEQTLLGFIMKQGALTYPHSLQLMAFLSYPVAAYTAPQLSADDLNQLAIHIKKPGISLTDLFQMILKRLSLKSLNVIWIEISRTTE